MWLFRLISSLSPRHSHPLGAHTPKTLVFSSVLFPVISPKSLFLSEYSVGFSIGLHIRFASYAMQELLNTGG